MMSNNKILTVSYGTFSCTLEGFDDSFGTMKAIAEYFRGLSSDAPYFGAEPPQPDADMLARIAQKEISRRVEAREHEGKIHLSAIENHAHEQATTPAPVLRDEPKEDAPIAEAVKVTATAAVASVEATPEVEAPAHQVSIEAETEVEPEAETEIAAHSEAVDVTVTAPTLPDTAEVEVAEHTVVEDENDVVPGQPDADVEAFFANSPDVVPAADEEDLAEAIEPMAAAMASPSDSIAAKLQRIRAVVAQHDDVEDDDEFAEDQHAVSDEVSEVEPENVMADARRDIEDALDADEAASVADDTSDDENDEDDIAAILGRLDAADADEAPVVEEDVVAVSQTSDATDDALDNLFGEDTDEDTDADENEDGVTPVVVQSGSDEPQETLRAPRARVIKVKRADLEAAIEKGELEEYADEQHEDVAPTLDDLAPARNGETSLSAEDEAELARELAELEADMLPDGSNDDSEDMDDNDIAEDDIATTEDVDHVEVPAAAVASPRRVLPSIDDTKGDDMDRLLAETDHQMDEPESATRRDAFSHLRAAVAAKKADVAMGATEASDDVDNDYRNDLADVVRPRRPAARSVRTERPGDARPAPLKLVAEQRIDVEQERPAGPVRPRRVAAVSDASPSEPVGESFADYAAEMGATKLPQLLEAAASYMSFVEGRDQFSRPQLMTKVRQVGPEDGFSREDGLRSFGQLLRAGKIEKIKGGRFTVSDEIGYRPDHRAAG